MLTPAKYKNARGEGKAIRKRADEGGLYLTRKNLKTLLRSWTSDPNESELTTWYPRVRARLSELWLLKAIGTTLFFTLFFIGYFHLLRHPIYPVTIMPLTALDRMMDFQPGAFALYASLWVYTSIPPALQPNLRALVAYGMVIGCLCLVGMACFLFFPTATPPPSIDWAQFPTLSILQRIDASGNACPSLHVAGAVFSGVWLNHQLREIGVPAAMRWLNWLWCAGIVYSALATKQHVVWDATAGLVLALIFAALSLPRKSAPQAALQNLA